MATATLTNTKVSVNQSDLQANLAMVSKAVSSRPSRPILSNVLLKCDAASQTVKLVGFDEMMGIECTFDAAVSSDWEFTLPSKLFGDSVSRLPDEVIDFSLDVETSTITLNYSSGSYQIRGNSAEDYPNIPSINSVAIEMDAAAILKGTTSTLASVSGDETKQVLTGVHVTSSDSSLEFAATTGHHLSILTEDSSTSLGNEVTVPGNAIRELNKMLGAYKGTDPVLCCMDDSQISFEFGGKRLISRLIEGQYPNYRQLVPASFTNEFTVDSKSFQESIERVAVVAALKNNVIKLKVKESEVTIVAEAQEVGSSSSTVPIQFNGTPLDIAFDSAYLLAGIKQMGTERIKVEMNTNKSPMVMTPVGGDKKLFLVMPVQIRS